MQILGSVTAPARPPWFTWTRVACFGTTAALLWFAFRSIDGAAFFQALRRTHLLWSGLAFAVYGMALAAGAWRWHVALRATERLVHAMATWRLALAGHFYFIALLGVGGGDLAKSATYARWFRFPLAEVLAAAPLDRVLSFGASVLIGVLAVSAAMAGGGLKALSQVNWQGSMWGTTGLGLLLVILTVWALWGPQGEGPWARTRRAIRSGGARLATSPRAGGSGLLAATIAQGALSAVFALNLLAVANAPIPWAQLAWTFPAITTLGAIPFTFAGTGVREVAAVTFLGWYGMPAGDAMAASLLTMGMRLAWAAMGAVVTWREQARQAAVAGPPLARTLSVIIPTLNEEAALPETVRRARANPGICEIIVVDGGSRDGTRELAARLGCEVLASPPGRGRQLRLGAARATGDVVLLLHADTWLPSDAAAAALNCLRDGSVVAGGFWKVFRDGNWMMKGSRVRCALRFWGNGRMLGDQAMFIRREVLEQIGGVPDMPLMEEFELCRRLRTVGRLALAPATVATSARRFARLGVLRTYLRMWRVTLGYRWGATPVELARLYEKD